MRRVLPLFAVAAGLSLAGCKTAADVVENALPGDLPTPSLGGGGSSSGQAPVYLFMFNHHYLGLGGYYPTAAEVRAVTEACVAADLSEHCTLFFDGLLVDKLKAEDPSLRETIRKNDFPIGYHGEESHGPAPVIVAIDETSPGAKMEEVVVEGWDFGEAVNAIRYRYVHGFQGCRFGATGYLEKGVGGKTDKGSTGGIRLVREWFDRNVEIMPGQAVFQPATHFAFQAESDIKMLQGSGVFAPHFLSRQHNPQLLKRTEAFLGEGTTLFWHMGTLAEKGNQKTMLPMWSTDSLAPRSAGGPSGRGYLGPHLLRFGADALGLSLPGPLSALQDDELAGLARAQQRPPRGKRPGGPQAGRSGAPSGQQPTPSRSGAAGNEVKKAFHSLDRAQPQVVTFKIDGTKAEVSDALSWVKQTTDSDRRVQLVTADELHERVKPSAVTLSASATAQAVLKYWSGGPPDYLVVDGGYASLTDGFEVMARHLAGDGDRVRTTDIVGPTGRDKERVSGSGSVTGAQVAAAAAGVVKAIDADPYRSIPMSVTVGKKRVGFHQYLRLMAQTIVQGEDAKLTVEEAEYAPPYARFLADTLGRDNKDRVFWMEAQFWTVKPVTWK